MLPSVIGLKAAIGSKLPLVIMPIILKTPLVISSVKLSVAFKICPCKALLFLNISSACAMNTLPNCLFMSRVLNLEGTVQLRLLIILTSLLSMTILIVDLVE